jgi:hypothetical protein
MKRGACRKCDELKRQKRRRLVPVGDLSKDLSRADFACKGEGCCEHSAPVDRVLVFSTQMLFDMIGVCGMESGYRCVRYNRQVGGTPGSQHPKARAIDLHPKDDTQTPDSMAAAAELVPAFRNGGIGIYSWGVHLDVRGRRARWDARG